MQEPNDIRLSSARLAVSFITRSLLVGSLARAAYPGSHKTPQSPIKRSVSDHIIRSLILC